MNQFVLFHFAITKNDRIYKFSVQPGAPWEDIEEVFKEFEREFLVLKEEAQKQVPPAQEVPVNKD